MTEIIIKTIKICNMEIYTKFSYRMLINALVLLLVSGMQFGDLTLKISSNCLLVIWIMFNVYSIFSLSHKQNRSFLWDLSYLSSNQKLIMLLFVAIIMNIGWAVIILIQLIFIMEADLLNALLLACTQYLFAISVGAMCGILHEKYVGIVIMVTLTVVNFLLYNPYIYEAASHFLSISEQLYAVNTVNATNQLSLVLLSLMSIFVMVLFSKSHTKYKHIGVFFVFVAVMMSYSIIIYYELSAFDVNKKSSGNSITIDNHLVEVRHISIKKAREMVEIITSLEKEYNEIQPQTQHSKIVLDKRYMSAFSWKIYGEKPSTVTFEEDNMQVIILSDAMQNFENAYYLRNFIEEMSDAMVSEIEGYNQNRYTRHILEGYNLAIIKELCSNLKQKKASKVETYFDNKITEVFNYPTTENNFVYRVALLIYEKFPSFRGDVYSLMLREKPQTGHEFARLLRTNYPTIVNDEEVSKILVILD